MNEKLLNSYLKRLDKALSGVSVSDRSEIVTEIKSHILDTVESNPAASVESVIRDLGEPSEVAKRYLSEKGISYQIPNRQPFFKWMVIGFLGTLGIITLFVLIMVWSFSPLIQVDERSGRVKILGGMIDVSSTDNLNTNFKFSHDGHQTSFNKGVKDLQNLEPTELRFLLKDTKVNFKNTNERAVKYSCSAEDELDIRMDTGVIFDLKDSSYANCDFEVPKNMNIVVEAKSGRVEFLELENSVQAKLKNGSLSFVPKSNVDYSYSVDVKTGHARDFVGSTSDKAYKIDLYVKTGTID